jgi:peptidoglycan/xylan/chitin deacetylase (PgdA/CDA1 family)
MMQSVARGCRDQRSSGVAERRAGSALASALWRMGIMVGLPGILATGPPAFAAVVEEYRAFFATCQAPQRERALVVLRTFRQGGEPFVLVVDPEDLSTQLLGAGKLQLNGVAWSQLREATKSTPYGRAMADAEKSAAAEQDAGIVHTLPPGNGVVLTVDLCPSGHPLDRALFAAVLTAFAPEEKPVPLGIAITGRWMGEHPDDLTWLKEMERHGEMVITWINHSFNHRYSKDLSMSQNFLLEPGTDLEAEILATEEAMIGNDLRPSVFFRFPGLVSNPDLVRRVIAHGLIPVGSDAWLAKNQAPSPGSIVLVHGNGNEPIGIEKFLALIKLEKASIRQKNWLLFDLRESVSRAEEAPSSGSLSRERQR